LRQIETELDVSIARRGHQFRVEGASENAQAAVAVLEFFLERARKTQRPISVDDIQLYFVELRGRRDAPYAPGNADESALPQLHTRRPDLRGRTPRQRDYIEAILAHDITIGIGPAGTGKTYLAVAAAVDALERDVVKRIVLTRPAVEAGERLGFLPGDLAQKVDPYLRPLYDALFDLLGFDKTQRLLERQTIEIAPLAYMRGRTLNQSFEILDEAQNTTREQMKMFLTRIGFGSKAVVTGDVTQMDLPRGTTSGLIEAQHVLAEVRGIAFTYFTAADVVRHPLVGRIVEAYEAAEERAQAAEAARPVAALVADTTRRRAS
jgi:phosphate starvation-inducible PhoH-like protein